MLGTFKQLTDGENYMSSINPNSREVTFTESDSQNLLVAAHEFMSKLENIHHGHTQDASRISKFREALWKKTGDKKQLTQKELANVYYKIAAMTAITTLASTTMSGISIASSMRPATQNAAQLYKTTSDAFSSLSNGVIGNVGRSYTAPSETELETLQNHMTKTWSQKQTEDDQNKEQKTSQEQKLNEMLLQILEKLSHLYTVR